MLRDTSESFILQRMNIDLHFFVVVCLLYIQNFIREDQNILLGRHTSKVQQRNILNHPDPNNLHWGLTEFLWSR